MPPEPGAGMAERARRKSAALLVPRGQARGAANQLGSRQLRLPLRSRRLRNREVSQFVFRRMPS